MELKPIPTELADRIEAYLNDCPADGRHSDAAGADAYELLGEARSDISRLTEERGREAHDAVANLKRAHRAEAERDALRKELRSIACATKDFEGRPMTADQMRKVASAALATPSDPDAQSRGGE